MKVESEGKLAGQKYTRIILWSENSCTGFCTCNAYTKILLRLPKILIFIVAENDPIWVGDYLTFN